MTDKFEKSSPFGKGVRPTAKFQKNKELRKSIYFEIRKLNATLHVNKRDSRYAQTIERFIDAMIPSKTGDDPGKLPVYASKSRSPFNNKPSCVFYLVSCLIQAYWKYLKGESEGDLINVEYGLKALQRVNVHYNQMVVSGDIREGYILKL